MERGEIEQSLPREERNGEPGSGRQFVADLIQRQRLQVGDISQYYDSWVNLLSESAGDIPPPMTRTIRDVSLGLGFLFYNQWAEMGNTGRSKQVAFQKRLQRRTEEYKGQLVLTREAGLLLRDAAAAVNVAYNPGGEENTPENIKKRTFAFADLGKQAQSLDLPNATNVVGAEK